MNKIIELENVCKTYEIGNAQLNVINNVSFSINAGDFVSIMGPSGSGKSTLLYLIGTIEKVTKGKVLINGVDVTKFNDKQLSNIRRNKVSFIYQFYNLMPDLSVEDNIVLPLLINNKKIGQYKSLLDEILNDVGLYDRRKHLPQELSGGQQQRTAIARALITGADVILADEPIGNLDSSTGMEIMSLLKKMNKKYNKTILQVTHSSASAQYGDSIIYINDGRVVDDSN